MVPCFQPGENQNPLPLDREAAATLPPHVQRRQAPPGGRRCSWAAASNATTPATMRCSTGRCGRPARRPVLLALLLQHLTAAGPLIFGIDETLDRGPRIKARGIYRDAVRSSRHQLVFAGSP